MIPIFGTGSTFWHTTGSGKTLTSIKATQILMNLLEIKKVVFVADRDDLYYQTSREFDSFSKGNFDTTKYSKVLISKLEDEYQREGFFGHDPSHGCSNRLLKNWEEEKIREVAYELAMLGRTGIDQNKSNYKVSFIKRLQARAIKYLR
jgi:dGTP triphosphohydrolase